MKMYRIALKLTKLSKISSFHDIFISSWEYDVEEDKLGDFIKELNQVADKYSETKRLINGKEIINKCKLLGDEKI